MGASKKMASEKKDPKPLQSERAVTGEKVGRGPASESRKRDTGQEMTKAAGGAVVAQVVGVKTELRRKLAQS
jgi:hypothetical protein